MRQPVSLEYLERVLAACPHGSATILGYGREMFELVRIEYGAIWVRPANDLKLTNDEPKETEDTTITGYWYLPKETYVG